MVGIHLSEPNARKLIAVLSEFRDGTTCEELRRKFQEITNRKGATFYDALSFAKAKGWIVADGKIYVLNPDGCWKVPPLSIEEQSERSRRNTDRLEHLANTRAQRIEQLQDQIDNLRDWANGGGSNAVDLIKILTDDSASTRQKIKAASIILGYRADPDVAAFTRRYLEDVCGNVSIAVDYRLQASELLRKVEGNAQLRPTIEKLTPPAPPVDPVKEEEQRRIEFERKKAHIERQAQLDAEEMRRDWERLSVSNGRPDLARN
jgi:hypothetical protein